MDIETRPREEKQSVSGQVLQATKLVLRGVSALRRPDFSPLRPVHDPSSPSTTPAARDYIEGEIVGETVVRTKTRPSMVLMSLIGLVLVPAAVISLYLFFIAANQYVSEARFTVQHAEREVANVDKVQGAAAATGGSSSAGMEMQDAEIVASYIRSEAIIKDLAQDIDLREIFRRPEADFWARLKKDATSEELRDYWLGMVRTYVENTSGIVRLEVRAFRREDALTLSKAILAASERMVNAMSERARQDTMHRAEEEVRRSEAAVRFALADLARFRDQAKYIDPVKVAEQTTKLMTQLTAEAIHLETELFIAKTSNSMNGPGITSLEAQITSTRRQIKELQAQLAGENKNSAEIGNVAASLVRFEELEIKRQFAETMYKFSQDSLVRARNAAERQSVYLTVFVPPALPQDYSYPLRFTYSVLITIGLLILWSIGAMTWASIEDHRL
ncbi:hypothetical protein [Beijerinckia mobilis]|uniref:hypothetical protein n=1 Tax=Beijerinckia mobilis TaxID=231434 RepID=UPI000691409B|nr:hypothetical protein [Beijerinckia mobilis]